MEISDVLEFAVSFTLALVIALYWKSRRPKNYPPGPLFGDLLQRKIQPAYERYMQMSEKYGDIVCVDFWNRAVVLNEYKVIKEALNEMAFAGRPQTLKFLEERSDGVPAGVMTTVGQEWIEQRRFILKNLRDFGFGKKSMEGLVLQEVEELIETFKKTLGTAIQTKNRFEAAVLNPLWSIITGERRAQDDLGHLILITNPIKMRVRYMTENIQAHQKTYQENSARDFIDVYLTQISKTTNSNSSFFQNKGVHNLKIAMLDLFDAGYLTTSATLEWEFLILAINPDVQEKLHEEIKQVVGISRLPSLNDRPLMPYTEAVIMEVTRYSAVSPVGLWHRTMEDVTLRGFNIPKDTLIIPNLYAALRHPKVWGDPDNFRPERFLSEDGKTVIKHEALIPFSTGKRVCLGQNFAKDELFLFTTSLFQRFRVEKNPNGPDLKIDCYYSAGGLRILKPHDLILYDRFEEN